MTRNTLHDIQSVAAKLYMPLTVVDAFSLPRIV